MKWNRIFKKLFSRSQPAVQHPGSPAPESAEPIRRADPNEKYRDPVYQKLTARCAMGDTVSMLELARWHRQFAHPEGEQLLAAHERDPESWKELDGWFFRYRYGSDGFHIRCYITWVCRAAIYGNSEAEALVARCPRFKDWSLLPESFYGLGPAPRYRSSKRFPSFELHRLGFTGISGDLEEFSLYPLKDGIYSAYFLEDYIPADSDGFGREDFYEDIFYDEFFNCLSGDKLSQARASLESMLEKRKAYWEDPAHDREHRMYKPLPSGGE